MFKCPECEELVESLEVMEDESVTCPECGEEMGSTEEEAMKFWVKEKTEEEKHTEEYAGWLEEQDEIGKANGW